MGGIDNVKRFILFTATALLLLIGTALVFADGLPDRYYLRISFTDSAAYKDALKEFNTVKHYDIAGVDRKNFQIDVFVSGNEFQELKGQYKLEVLATPQDMTPDRVDPLYKNPTEMETLVQEFHAEYPDITALISIGTTEEGRTMRAIKISDNPSVDEDEPVVLFNAQHHAREVMTPEIMLDAIEYLCSHYGSDPRVTHWIDTLEIWIVPMVNLDGVNYVFTQDDYWRKDRHSPPPGSSCYGIDPNRNYESFWGTCDGSSGDPCDDLYRGTLPGQAQCVTNMMNFASTIKPVFDISFHTYSELVLYPYGCTGVFTPENELISDVGRQMAALIETDDGTMGYSPGTSWELLYATDGGDIDWYYAELGTFAFVIEVNSWSQGFLPPYNPWRDDTVLRLRPAWQYLLDRVEGPAITGLVRDACSGTPLNARVILEEYPLTADESPRMTDSFGRYFRVVAPGIYHVNVSAPGYTPVTLPVSVQNSRVNLNIDLVPDGSYGLYVIDHTALDSDGDNDGVIDPGERVALEVFLQSIGSTTNVSADITTSDPYVTIETGHAEFGDIEDGATGGSITPHFVISVDHLCPSEHIVEFQVSIHADQTICTDSGILIEKVSNYVYECPIYEELLDSDPSWPIQNIGTGGWAFGHPTAGPVNGHTGTNCYGTNLSGEYGDNGDFTLTSLPFDCTNVSHAELIFWRWLENESGYDTAYVQVSNDNVTWNTVWSGYGDDLQWTEQRFDISETADGQPYVYIRWKLTSDGSVTRNGFYIDDVTICGDTLPPNVPSLRHLNHAIDDSAGGNDDGQINPGESIHLSVTLENPGTDATGVFATLSSNNPHVTITTPSADFPDIAQNGSGTSSTDYVFTISTEADDGETIHFELNWFSNEFSGRTQFIDMIVAPTLTFSSMGVLDGSGDNDGVLDPGETAQIRLTLLNTGNGSAHNVTGTLSSNHPEYITMPDPSASFIDIVGGGEGDSIAPHFTVMASPSTPNHTLITFTVSLSASGYTTTDTFEMDVTSSNFIRRYEWSLNTNPGWTTEGQWAWGIPQGSNGDPTSGFTGSNVYGYNLAGAYPNNLPETNLTSTAIDCSHLMNIEVRFMRWLGIESATWDHASFRVSVNGTNWTTVWEHTGSTLIDTSWQSMSFDISNIASHQSTVYLRWVMGSTDSSVTYCGWNLDDIEIWAESDQPVNTPTPTAPPTCIHDGDVNMNGSITAGDAQLSFQIALGAYSPSETEFCAADCNGNSSVTAGDAQGIFAAALGLGSCVDPITP